MTMRSAFVVLVVGVTTLSPRLGAQTILLRIKPHAGDTLRMQLDQQVEMTGTRHTSVGESSNLVVTTMKMYSRAVVEGIADDGTNLLAVTDSVLLNTTDNRARADAARVEAQMRGQRVRFRVAPDGTVGMVQMSEGTPREVSQVVALMPPAFPRSKIKVGESWIRELQLPSGPQLGAQISGKLHVTFRLDSVTHGGDWAFVSMRGEMVPAAGPPAGSGTVIEKGVVNGTMLVDQRRGWLTQSWFAISVSSVVTPPLVTGVGPMHLLMRITQHMHTLDRR